MWQWQILICWRIHSEYLVLILFAFLNVNILDRSCPPAYRRTETLLVLGHILVTHNAAQVDISTAE